MDLDAHDTLEERCRMLGHPVPFQYCRKVADGLPCRLVIECWTGQFDASAHLREHFTDGQIEKIFTPPKPKLTTLVELIERARRQAGPDG